MLIIKKLPKLLAIFLTVVAMFVTLFYTRFDAVSWNDTSRFATIESVVNRHTLSIDHSYFYTGDKVKVKGRFFSDKPPLFSLVASGPYFFLHIFGWEIYSHPLLVVYITNVIILLLPYLIFGLFLYFLFKLKENKEKTKFLSLDVVILMLGTMLWPFCTQLNNHLPTAIILGLVSILFLVCDLNRRLSFILGFLLGVATVFDLAAGIVSAVFLLMFFFVLLKNKGIRQSFYLSFSLGLGLVIPLVIHYFVNVRITGDIFPGAMHPEFFNFPGSQFNSNNLTGEGWAMHSLKEWWSYVGLMLVGKRGLFFHNPVLMLAVVASVSIGLWDRDFKWRWYSWFALVTSLLVIINYSLTGKGSGGGAYSVRWFVIFIPLFFPILLRWISEGRTQVKRMILYILAIITIVFNIMAMGNILGGANHGDRYSFQNMYYNFPGYNKTQWKIWNKILLNYGLEE